MNRKPGDVLYHYTGINSLLNIVNSKSIWITDIHYMNDASEIKFAAKKLNSLIRKRVEKETKNSLTVFLSQLIDWLKNFEIIPYHIFTFSLTENGNLLSQWRSYTPLGKGVSIGFNKKQFENRAQKNGFILLKCIYDSSEQEAFISRELEACGVKACGVRLEIMYLCALTLFKRTFFPLLNS